MSLLQSSSKPQKYLLFLCSLVISIANFQPAVAHKIEIAGNVGATLHIEPNDNPRAGEPTQAWFALTRKGGKTIPLAQCNCQLVVYAEPHTPKEPPLLEPALKPVTAERYQDIPGAEITFPKPGIYQLQLRGKPNSGASFKPFGFKFDVTVAAGGNAQNVRNVNEDVVQSESLQFPLWAIALPILAVMGILFTILQGRRRGG
ncbi:MAG: FixH family protein [Desmonostoc vinosum HA7617-LM4]|nr:FixH family protein [Desmonostoc vinosum HA7617-LM4]